MTRTPSYTHDPNTMVSPGTAVLPQQLVIIHKIKYSSPAKRNGRKKVPWIYKPLTSVNSCVRGSAVFPNAFEGLLDFQDMHHL